MKSFLFYCLVHLYDSASVVGQGMGARKQPKKKGKESPKGEFVVKQFRGRNEDYKQKVGYVFPYTNDIFPGLGSLTSGHAFPQEDVDIDDEGYPLWPDLRYGDSAKFKYSLDASQTISFPNMMSPWTGEFGLDTTPRWDSFDTQVTFCETYPIFGGCYYFKGGGAVFVDLASDMLPNDMNDVKYRGVAIGGSGILGRTIANRFGYVVVAYKYMLQRSDPIDYNDYWQKQWRDLEISYFQDSVENINDLLDFAMVYPEFLPMEARIGDDMFNKTLPTIPPRGKERDELISEYLTNH
mmetsp:Transcript_13296/g.15478  ORF Transcript_13296/g.15478 Transcript_13296/m.15478 type:complete len:295 (-) Transcript_13296:617-1501(-)